MEIRIKGQVLGYCDDVAAGVILGEDGRKYQFEKTEWRPSHRVPANKANVIFTAYSGKAVQVDGA